MYTHLIAACLKKKDKMACVRAGIRMQTSMFSHRLTYFNKFAISGRLMSSMPPVSTNVQAVKKDVKPFDAIPGLTSLPLIGTTWSFLLEGLLPGAKPLGKRFLDAQARDVNKYGKIYRVQVPGLTIVAAADPEDAATVFRNDGKYPKRFNSPLLDFYRKTRKKIPGVFFADGKEWYKHRSVISKRILRPKEIEDYAPEFNEIVTDFISRLREIRLPVGSDKENEVPHLDNELFKWSFESVADVLFDRRFGCLEEEMNEEAQEFITSIGRVLSTLVNASLLPVGLYKIYETKSFKTFCDSFDKMYKYAELFTARRVEELRQKNDAQREEKRDQQRNDQDAKASFFDFLLASEKLTEDDLLASIIDLLFAGVDTTSNTMQWVLYLLAKNPDKQEKLYQEVSSVLGPGEQADMRSLAQMPYLKACVRETLRLYPVLSSLPRILENDTVLQGYTIPAGAQVEFLFYYMSRSEEIFPEASLFKPERWLRDESHIPAGVKLAFASLPFGFGTRMCLGRRIAELEMHLLLSRLVRQFWINYPQGVEVKPTTRGVTIPDRDVRVKFEDREIK